MQCPICTSTCGQRESVVPDAKWLTCFRCGDMLLTGTSEVTLPTTFARGQADRTLLSHKIRKMQAPGKQVMISESLIQACSDPNTRPTPSEQLNSLVLWIGQNQKTHSAYAQSTIPPIAATIGADVEPNNNSEPAFSWLIDQAKPEGLFQQTHVSGGEITIRLTMKGWDRYETLKRQTIDSRRAFMAMQFGDELLTRVMEECFKPAVAAAGFELRPVYVEQPAGLIDDHIRAAIRASRFIVADLSHGNRGAYFEAGFAEGLELPVFYTCDKSRWEEETPHFDTNHMNTVIWSADNLEDARRRLTSMIRATLPGEATME